MTLPEFCDFCGAFLNPWNPNENTPCRNCGNIVPTWENCTPDQRRTRIRQQARRQAIEDAATVPVKEDKL